MVRLARNSASTKPKINKVGIAYRSTSEFLKGFRYDAKKTKELNLNDKVEGAAFVNNQQKYRFVLLRIQIP